MLDGSDVHGLDQIGLSQKAGPVVSDLRITRRGRLGSNRLGNRQADLLLAFDLAGGRVAHRAGRGRRGPHIGGRFDGPGAPRRQDRPSRDRDAHRF